MGKRSLERRVGVGWWRTGFGCQAMELGFPLWAMGAMEGF